MSAHQPLAIDMESIKRGLGSSSITSLASFYIPKPVLKSKARAVKTQMLLFLLQVVFSISACLGVWIIFDLKDAETIQKFTMTDTLSQQSSDPSNPSEAVEFPLVPYTAQYCVYAVLATSIAGFLSSLVVAYSSRIGERITKILLGLSNICAVASFFIAIAAQIGFETSISQMAAVNAVTGTTSGVNYSGRGYGYSGLVIVWILAIPLVLLTITTFFGHIRRVWENEWRQSLRKSFGSGIPAWLNGQDQTIIKPVEEVSVDSKAPASIRA